MPLYFFQIKQLKAVKLHFPVFGRKRRFVHKSKLDWDVHSSSGRYVRKRCKPLKVSRILEHFFSASELSVWSYLLPVWSQLGVPIIEGNVHACICVLVTNKLEPKSTNMSTVHIGELSRHY